MPSVERTAYPRFNRNLTAQELSRFFTPTEEELALARAEARGERHQLCFLTLLKCFQRLHDFPVLGQIPAAVVEQIREHARIPKETLLEYELPKTFYRHCRAIREYLGVHAYYGKQAHHIAVTAAYQAAQIMDQSSDVINSVIDELFEQQFEFPAYSALQRVAERINAIVQRRLFQKVFGRWTPQQTEVLDHLLVVEFDQRQSAFNLLKKLPQRPSRTHLEELLDHLDWLESLGDVAGPLEGVPATKIRSFANRTKAQDASDLRDFTPARRYTMLLCLIHRMRVRARDDVGEMFIKRMATIHKRAKEELIEIHLRQRERTERRMQKLDEVAVVAASDLSDAEVGRQTRSLLDMEGGLEKIREECAAVQVWNGNNHLALLWPHYRSVPSVPSGARAQSGLDDARPVRIGRPQCGVAKRKPPGGMDFRREHRSLICLRALAEVDTKTGRFLDAQPAAIRSLRVLLPGGGYSVGRYLHRRIGILCRPPAAAFAMAGM